MRTNYSYQVGGVTDHDLTTGIRFLSGRLEVQTILHSKSNYVITFVITSVIIGVRLSCDRPLLEY